MAENGYITDDEAIIAKSKELITVQGGQLASKRASRAPRTYFTDEIRRQLSLSFGEKEFFTGGLACKRNNGPKITVRCCSGIT
jgi:penicillin-binding protein 1A